MFSLAWDQTGQRLYETGTDRGVLYPQNALGQYPKGVAWNGLTGVTESPSGADKTDLWADNIKYLSLRAAEDFGATVTCYMYPDEWMECDGSAQPIAGVTIGQQTRKPFGLSFRSIIGNDTESNDHGYKIHIIYNATASPSERAYSSVTDSPEAIEFSYEIATTPTNINGYKPIASMVIDSTEVAADRLAALEAVLYGNGSTDPRLPLPDEVIEILGGTSVRPYDTFRPDPTVCHDPELRPSVRLNEHIQTSNHDKMLFLRRLHPPTFDRSGLTRLAC